MAFSRFGGSIMHNQQLYTAARSVLPAIMGVLGMGEPTAL